MAETRKIKIDVDTNASEAAKDFNNLADNIEDSTDKVKDLNAAVKKADKATDGATSGFKKIGTAVKGIGTAFKAAGIGLIIGVLAGLKSAFEGNSETARGFSVVMETLSILFNQTVGAISKAVQAAYQATGGFNALGKVMGGLLNLVLTPFKAAFFGLKLGLQELQLAWEKSFFGDKDPDTIKALRKNIKDTQKDLKEVGEDAIKSGKDIYNNFGEAVSEVVTLGMKGVEEIGKISVKAAYEQAGALVDARNAAAIAAAQQGKLVEQYDMQAEKLRQIRDEERNSIAERMKANEDLKKVLNDQEKAMLAQADAQVTAAQFEAEKNKNTENTVALIEAQANRVGVLAQIEGLRSEQLANDLALQREADELLKTRTESEVTLAIEREKATNEFIKDEEKKLQAQIDTANKERELQLARLQDQIDLYTEGTQARLDAEIAYNEAKQALDIQILQYEDQLATKRVDIKKAADEKEIESDKAKHLAKVDLVLKYADTFSQAMSSLNNLLNASDEERLKNVEKGSKEEDAIKRKMFERDKRLRIVQTIIDTASNVVTSVRNGGGIPTGIPFGIAAGAMGALQIAAIGKAKYDGGGSVSPPTAGGIGGGAQAPQFNVVGNSGMNQLAQIQQTPIQAYVVSGEVTSAQSLDRNRIQNATL